jgi:predicted DNA repair protein MutK
MALILVYTYFWQIIVGALLVGGAYLTFENVRDLLTARKMQ